METMWWECLITLISAMFVSLRLKIEVFSCFSLLVFVDTLCKPF